MLTSYLRSAQRLPPLALARPELIQAMTQMFPAVAVARLTSTLPLFQFQRAAREFALAQEKADERSRAIQEGMRPPRPKFGPLRLVYSADEV